LEQYEICQRPSERKARIGLELPMERKSRRLLYIQVPRQVHRIRPPIGEKQLLASSSRSASRILLCVFVDVQVSESEDSAVKKAPHNKMLIEIPKRGQNRLQRHLVFRNLSNNSVIMEKSYCEPQLANEENEISEETRLIISADRSERMNSSCWLLKSSAHKGMVDVRKVATVLDPKSLALVSLFGPRLAYRTLQQIL
jgi:hypothetical protein